MDFKRVMGLRQTKKPTKTTLLLFTFSATNLLAAQNQQTINGAVQNDNKVLLPDTSILVTGTTLGTTTDFDENYNLQPSIQMASNYKHKTNNQLI